jgi:putative membrane protein
MWPFMGSMSVWMVLWWGTGIVVLLLLIRVISGPLGGSPPKSDDSPEQILKKRYAKGEIDREEYQRRLEDVRR